MIACYNGSETLFNNGILSMKFINAAVLKSGISAAAAQNTKFRLHLHRYEVMGVRENLVI